MTATAAPAPVRPASAHRPPPTVPFVRLVDVELRKMVDTRASFWLLVAVAFLVATSAASVFLQPAETWTYRSFLEMIARAAVISAPMIAVLSVTSEWSQRAALTTFTLVPRRGRVVAAKGVCAAGTIVAVMVLAFATAALCTVLGAALSGTEAVWDVAVGEQLRLMLFQAVSMAVAFVLGVVVRSSPGALVGYLLFALVLPVLSTSLAAMQEWYRDVAPWVDLTAAQAGLLGPVAPTGEAWVQLAVTAALWLVIPLALGMRRLLRVEIR